MIKILQFFLYPVHVWWWGFAGRWGLMLFKKGGDAPPPPDYNAAAQAQGKANIDAARTSAKLSNPNYITPLGTQTVTYGSERQFDQNAYNAAMQDYQRQLSQSQQPQYGPGNKPGVGVTPQNANVSNPVMPNRSDYFYGGDQDVPTIEMNLSPEEQAIFETDQRIRGDLGGLAEGLIGRVGESYDQPFDFSSATDARDQAQEALMSRLEPQLQRDEESMQQRLANQGIPVGSEAWNREMDAFNRSKAESRTSAILNAGQEQDRMVQLSNFLRNMPLNELNALQTGAQVQMPQFQGYQGQDVAPAPVYNAANQQYQAQLGQHNADQAAGGGMMSGLFGLGGALLGAGGAAKGFGNLFNFG